MGELDGAVGIIAGALCGAAVGIEREWSGHAYGPEARFAGVRTFTLLGGPAGIAGWLWARAYQVPATVLLAAARVPAPVAAQAITIGVVSNTAFKAAVALAVGGAEFRRWTTVSLAVLGGATALSVGLMR